MGGGEMGTVTATPEALDLIAEIVADHGPVLFHQSGAVRLCQSIIAVGAKVYVVSRRAAH
jgi:uncharacterized protein (DUF779 family)